MSEKPLELMTTENNGPASIVMIVDRLLAADSVEDDDLEDIRHLALVTCEYIRQIKAVYAPRWHDCRREYEDKMAAEKIHEKGVI